MKDLIYKYLDDNFKLNFEAYTHCTLYDVTAKGHKGVGTIIKEVRTVFFVESDVFMEVFDEWIVNKVGVLMLGLTEIQTKLQELTGKEVSITETDLNHFTATHDAFMKYIRTTYVDETNTEDFEYVLDEITELRSLRDITQGLLRPIDTTYEGQDDDGMSEEDGS